MFDLRHTNATSLIYQNIDVAVVAVWLGHPHITTTFNYYMYHIIFHDKNARNVSQTY